ncbi:hypothetical protein [Heyndrickxia coagulans]|nr:hypothetical protein [Heyndrickxia coagulans]
MHTFGARFPGAKACEIPAQPGGEPERGVFGALTANGAVVR